MSTPQRRRRNGKIDRLPPALREEVDQMILAGFTYREIVEYLQMQGVQLSRMAVCTYARKFLATAQVLHIAQENFKMLTDELERHPNLDTTEGLIRLMSNHILNTLANTTEEDWQNIEPERLLKEATSLVRAAAYKRRSDVQNRSDLETALEANKELLYDALGRRHPELYDQLQKTIKNELSQEEQP